MLVDCPVGFYSRFQGHPENNDERQLVDACIPFFLDRLCDQSRLLDAHSAHYLAITISAYLTQELLMVEKVCAHSTNCFLT